MNPQKYLIYLVFLISCAAPSSEEQTAITAPNEDSVKIDPFRVIAERTIEEDPSAIIYEANQKAAEIYWKKIRELNANKARLFQKEVYEPAMNGEKLTENNRIFLEALKSKIVEKEEEKFDIGTEILFPFYRFSPSLSGFAYEFDSSKENTTYRDSLGMGIEWTADNKQIAVSAKVKSVDDSFEPIFKRTDLQEEKLAGLAGKEYYLYGEKYSGKASIIDFGFQMGECIEYYIYTTKTEASKSDRPLFASTLALDLIQASFPRLDSLLADSKKAEYYDCNYGMEKEIIYAKLEGIPNLYFAYNDSFPYNTKKEYPGRSLLMLVGSEVFVPLWAKDIDFFGCPCL